MEVQQVIGKDRLLYSTSKCLPYSNKRRASVDQDLHDDPTTTSTIDPQSILLSEVEAAIKRLKRNKAPGEDNITGGILQDGGEAMI